MVLQCTYLSCVCLFAAVSDHKLLSNLLSARRSLNIAISPFFKYCKLFPPYLMGFVNLDKCHPCSHFRSSCVPLYHVFILPWACRISYLLVDFMHSLLSPNPHFSKCTVVNGEASTGCKNSGTVTLNPSKQNSSMLYFSVSSVFQYGLRRSCSSLFGFLPPISVLRVSWVSLIVERFVQYIA